MPHLMKDVIVVVPGIMGSVLERDSKEVWAPSGGAVWNFLKSRSKSIKSLALPAYDDGSLDDLGDGVVATRLMPDVHLMPGLWSIDGYGAIGATIAETFEVRPQENYFEFAYDWRRNNLAHGRRLRRESHDWLQAWRQTSGNDDAKLIILAHSMGGLVARSFLELEDGWSDTNMLITFGTPYAGSLNSLNFIANGFKKGLGPVGIDLSEMVRSLTSIQQLLPTFACIDIADGHDPVTCVEAEIPHLQPADATAALDFHRTMQDAATARGRQRIHPIVGIRQPTLQRATLRAGSLWVSSSWDAEKPGVHFGGDGTVPRRSATPPEMAGDLTGTVYSAVQHGSLQNTGSLLAHVEGLLTEQLYQLPVQNAAAVKFVTIDLDDDYFEAGEAVSTRVSTSEIAISYEIAVTDEATNELVTTLHANNLDGSEVQTVDVNGLAEGTYRLTVSTPGTDTAPVSKVIVVWGGEQ